MAYGKTTTDFANGRLLTPLVHASKFAIKDSNLQSPVGVQIVEEENEEVKRARAKRIRERQEKSIAKHRVGMSKVEMWEKEIKQKKIKQ